MNGAHANNNKRRSARLAFDEDDAPPTKKTKAESAAAGSSTTTTKVALANGNGAAAAKTMGGKAAAMRSKATKSYEEVDDGFSFSRTRSKRAKAKTTAGPAPKSVQGAQTAPEPEPVEEAPKPAPSKRRPRKTLPTTPERETAENAPKRRRSKRLSGENEQTQPGSPDPRAVPVPKSAKAHPKEVSTPVAQTAEPESPIQTQEQEPQEPGSQKLHVDKKRRLTKIPLPFADTPIIKRNKEMRKNSAEQHRRSSSGMRGRRASSLIDAGTSNGESVSANTSSLQSCASYDHPINHSTGHDLNVVAAEDGARALSESLCEGPDVALVVMKKRPQDIVSQIKPGSLADVLMDVAVPHAEVETKEFYKHISQDLMEPKRMRQLLTWCGTRALLEKPRGNMDQDEASAVHAALAIQKELLNEFGSRSEMSNWFDREDTAQAVIVKKPNPRNVQNAAKLQELEAELARLQAEKRSWDELRKSTPAPAQQTDELLSLDLDAAKIDSSLLDPSQAEMLKTLLSTGTTISSSSTSQQLATAAAPPPLPVERDPFAKAPRIGAASQIPQPTSSHLAPPPPSAPSQPSSSAVPSSQLATNLVSTTQARLNSLTASLEFKIDLFADSLHRVDQYRQCVEHVADTILATAAQKLEDRDRERKERNGGAVDSIDVLRGLSRTMNGGGRG